MSKNNYKINIINNPKNLRLETKKGEKSIQIVCLHYKDKKQRVMIDLDIAQGSQVYLIILVYLKGCSYIDLITVQKHKQRQGFSDLLCKAVLADQSQFVFKGMICIDRNGANSHAYQRNDNLLLNSGVSAISEPQLEIKANEVFCTHGATTTYLNSEQQFYLQSRGLTKKKVNQLLIKGFLQAALDKLLMIGVDLKELKVLNQKLCQTLKINEKL